MSSVQLLDNTRKIGKLLHNNSSHKVVFNDICKVMSEMLSSNVLVLSKKGKVLGLSSCPTVEDINVLIRDKVGGFVDSMFNERLLNILSTKENVNLETLGFDAPYEKKYQAITTPIDIAGEFGLKVYNNPDRNDFRIAATVENNAAPSGVSK